MSRKFTWNAWDFDSEGEAYIIAKAECPEREKVPDFICQEDGTQPDRKLEMVIQEGWGKYQVRTDWENFEGEAMGGYYITQYEPETKNIYGKRKPGWFPVWIVRKGEWY